MLIDTHCHINMMVKKTFDIPLTATEIAHAQTIVDEAALDNVTRIINVGTNLIESSNCIALAKHYNAIYASVGLHPNDCTPQWQDEIKELKKLAHRKDEYKIVAIGECGIDRHYPDYNLQRQKDVFKAQIELALEYDLALIVHTRDAAQETARSLDEFRGQLKRGVIHCFSEDQDFADWAIDFGFALGIGGTITYPKNNLLRAVVTKIPLTAIILETDAPFLPPQAIRGKQNHPRQIATIAQYLADLRQEPVETIAQETTQGAMKIFGSNSPYSDTPTFSRM
jgi:TatD DNase family protein